MRYSIAVFGALFALVLVYGGALALDLTALGCGIGCLACSTFAIGLATKAGGL